MSWLASLLLLVGAALIPAWLLVVGRRLRYKGRRVRGAFWGGVIGHLIGDALFLGVLLGPPLAWPPGRPVWTITALLVVPPVLGVLAGTVIGRRGRAG